MILKNKNFLSLFASIALSYSVWAQTPAEPQWTFLADATNSDFVTDLWVSPQGESYTFGHIVNLEENDFLDGLMLLKTSADGQELWRKYYHAQSNDYRLFASCVVGDENGNIFLVYSDDCRYAGMLNNARIVVKKIDPDGNVIWSNFYTDVIENLVESPQRRSGVYKNGILYFVSGTGGTNPSDDSDAMVVKIDGASGNLIQKIVFNSQYDTDDMFRRVAVADNGDTWAIGRSRGYMYPGGIYSHYDANIVKYNAAGEFQWEHRENGSSNTEDHGINMAIDAQGNSYTSNQLRMIGISQRRVQIQKLSPAGEILWTHFYQGSSSGYTHDQPVIVLPNGNVVFSTSNANGLVTRGIDGQTGQELWTQNYNRSEAGAANRPYDMKADSAGNIYITGSSRDNTPLGQGWDFLTMKYSSDGELLWLSNFNRGNYDSSGDTGAVLQFDAEENVYVAGGTQLNEAGNYNNDVLLLKFGNGLLASKEFNPGVFSSYPNPVVGTLNIKGSDAAITKVILYDIYGHEVSKWENLGSMAEVSLDMGGIAQGIYLAAVFSENQSQSLKIMKK